MAGEDKIEIKESKRKKERERKKTFHSTQREWRVPDGSCLSRSNTFKRFLTKIFFSEKRLMTECRRSSRSGSEKLICTLTPRGRACYALCSILLFSRPETCKKTGLLKLQYLGTFSFVRFYSYFIFL